MSSNTVVLAANAPPPTFSMRWLKRDDDYQVQLMLTGLMDELSADKAMLLLPQFLLPRTMSFVPTFTVEKKSPHDGCFVVEVMFIGLASEHRAEELLVMIQRALCGPEIFAA